MRGNERVRESRCMWELLGCVCTPLGLYVGWIAKRQMTFLYVFGSQAILLVLKNALFIL